MVLPQESFDGDKDLDIALVPKGSQPPTGFTLYLYYCYKPGKWTKRYVTLLETGQIYVGKKPNIKVTDKDCQKICHLSDFDIYTPTEAQMRRHLKPPKKFCYAIKSQQRATVFVNMDSYVHYFCTEDPKIAQQFHSLVHGWRSWHLVNKYGSVEFKKKAKVSRAPTVKYIPKKINVMGASNHHLKALTDESSYASGDFQSFIDYKIIDKPIDESGKNILPDPKLSHPRQPQPVTPKTPRIPKRFGKSQEPPKTLLSVDNTEFRPNGLLGDAYDVRKADEAEKQRDAQLHVPLTEDGAFISGNTLLNNMAVSPESVNEERKFEPKFRLLSATEHSTRQKTQAEMAAASRSTTNAGEHLHSKPLQDFSLCFGPSFPGSSGGLRPSASVRSKGRRPSAKEPGPVPGSKPLVDLTPKFQEAPQWRQQGGHGVKAPAGIHLVDMISPSQPPSGVNKNIQLPPKTPIRRATTSSGSIGSGQVPLLQKHESPQSQRSQQLSILESETKSMHQRLPSMTRQRSRSIATNNNGGKQAKGRTISQQSMEIDSRQYPPVPSLPLRAKEMEVRIAAAVTTSQNQDVTVPQYPQSARQAPNSYFNLPSLPSRRGTVRY